MQQCSSAEAFQSLCPRALGLLREPPQHPAELCWNGRALLRRWSFWLPQTNSRLCIQARQAPLGAEALLSATNSSLKTHLCLTIPLFPGMTQVFYNTHSGELLTSAQRRSTASNTSSWCPILATPSSSRSWCVIFSSCSPLIFSRSKLLTYCWRLSSNPGHTKQRRQMRQTH